MTLKKQLCFLILFINVFSLSLPSYSFSIGGLLKKQAEKIVGKKAKKKVKEVTGVNPNNVQQAIKNPTQTVTNEVQRVTGVNPNNVQQAIKNPTQTVTKQVNEAQKVVDRTVSQITQPVVNNTINAVKNAEGEIPKLSGISSNSNSFPVSNVFNDNDPSSLSIQGDNNRATSSNTDWGKRLRSGSSSNSQNNGKVEVYPSQLSDRERHLRGLPSEEDPTLRQRLKDYKNQGGEDVVEYATAGTSTRENPNEDGSANNGQFWSGAEDILPGIGNIYGKKNCVAAFGNSANLQGCSSDTLRKKSGGLLGSVSGIGGSSWLKAAIKAVGDVVSGKSLGEALGNFAGDAIGILAAENAFPGMLAPGLQQLVKTGNLSASLENLGKTVATNQFGKFGGQTVDVVTGRADILHVASSELAGLSGNHYVEKMTHTAVEFVKTGSVDFGHLGKDLARDLAINPAMASAREILGDDLFGQVAFKSLSGGVNAAMSGRDIGKGALRGATDGAVNYAMQELTEAWIRNTDTAKQGAEYAFSATNLESTIAQYPPDKQAIIREGVQRLQSGEYIRSFPLGDPRLDVMEQFYAETGVSPDNFILPSSSDRFDSSPETTRYSMSGSSVDSLINRYSPSEQSIIRKNISRLQSGEATRAPVGSIDEDVMDRFYSENGISEENFIPGNSSRGSYESNVSPGADRLYDGLPDSGTAGFNVSPGANRLYNGLEESNQRSVSDSYVAEFERPGFRYSKQDINDIREGLKTIRTTGNLSPYSEGSRQKAVLEYFMKKNGINPKEEAGIDKYNNSERHQYVRSSLRQENAYPHDKIPILWEKGYGQELKDLGLVSKDYNGGKIITDWDIAKKSERHNYVYTRVKLNEDGYPRDKIELLKEQGYEKELKDFGW